MLRRIAVSCSAASTVLLLACAPQEQPESPTVAGDTAVTSPRLAADTIAEMLWGHLEATNYRQWSMWPGKSALYAGTEPHGALLTTYVNPIAQQALNDRSGTFISGSIIVKENYMPDSTFAAATVMYKSAGYDPASNDWFWLKRNADGTIEASGRVQDCIACHRQRAGNDYIMTSDIR